MSDAGLCRRCTSLHPAQQVQPKGFDATTEVEFRLFILHTRETFISGLKSVDFLIGVEFKRQLGAPAQ